MAPTQNQRLFLIDGMSQLYRAYYAIRSLSTSGGQATNAIYGFTMMLRRLINHEKPDYLGVAFDSPEPTFRHEQFDKYKAHRAAMPDDLVSQLPYVERVCQALRVPLIRLAGFEADDIIGTLACKAEAAGLDVAIVSNDKDLCQLITDQVKILRTEQSGDLRWMDAKGVEEKFSVRPDQIVDLLGLWGDASDNIPGAPGIGEKGAKALIQQYGDIENAIAHADEISRKVYRESLQNNADLIRQSRELARIVCDMPIELDLKTLIYEEPDRRLAYELFAELEFNTLTREFTDAANLQTIAAVAARKVGTPKYSLITKPAALDELIKSLWSGEGFAVALAERGGAVFGLAISTAPAKAALIDFEKFKNGAAAFAKIQEVLENGLLAKSVHDWKTTLTLLHNYVETQAATDEVNQLEASPLFASTQPKKETSDGAIQKFSPAIHLENVVNDTLLAAYLLDPNRSNYPLPEIAREYLGLTLPAALDGFEADELRALQNADLTFQLAEVLRAQLQAKELENIYTEIELPLVEVLFEMERVGVRIDFAALEKAGGEMEKELTRLTKEIYALAGCEFNINSPTQLGDLFERLNFEVSRRTKTGKISTSNDVLEELATKYELPKLIIEYREIAKLKNTYVDALPKLINPRTGRVHTTLNQAVAATGRLSSTNPNLQNIPVRTELGRRIRAAFVPSPGYVLMSADYSQIELRLFAHLTGDELMTEAFQKGEDIHAKTAREVFGAKTKQEEHDLRRLAKIVNFAIPYAVAAFGLAQRTTLSRAEAKKAIDDYYATYKGVRRYMETVPEQVRETGFVKSIFGRRRPIPDINNKNHALRARAEREAINAPLQASAADLMKMAMLKVHDRLEREGMKAQVVLQVHDELLLEVPETEIARVRELVKAEMEAVYKLSVPLIVEVHAGKNWMAAKP
ncbi:MAG: DNA polymerase I [Acidobacteria bacterium]|nr:DNA polymerase I [Acidobacteriota bacterium]